MDAVGCPFSGDVMTTEERCHKEVASLVRHLLGKPNYERTYKAMYNTMLPAMLVEEFPDDESIENTYNESE
jgi:hypothetical protein